MEDFSHPKFSNFSDSYIFCAESSNKLELAENRFCTTGEWEHKEISDKEYEVKNENGTMVLSKPGRNEDSLDVNSNDYCVGYYDRMRCIISHSMTIFELFDGQIYLKHISIIL